MDDLITCIEAGLSQRASAEDRAPAVDACHSLTAMLAPDSEVPVQTGRTGSSGRSHLPPDQLLELVIARLRAMVPEHAAVKPVTRFQVPIIVPPPRLRGGVP